MDPFQGVSSPWKGGDVQAARGNAAVDRMLDVPCHAGMAAERMDKGDTTCVRVLHSFQPLEDLYGARFSDDACSPSG